MAKFGTNNTVPLASMFRCQQIFADKTAISTSENCENTKYLYVDFSGNRSINPFDDLNKFIATVVHYTITRSVTRDSLSGTLLLLILKVKPIFSTCFIVNS